MERERVTSKHETIVQSFLKDAIQEGAHLKKPPRFSEDQWIRLRNIGGVYNGSPAVFEDLAHMYGLSEERIRQLNKTFLINLWSNSSDELKDRCSLNELLTARKPLSQRSREKISLVGGGRSLKIREQVESGVTDIDKISENTGISKKNVREAAIHTLRDWGINVPRQLASHKEDLEQLETETDDKKTQELLDKIPLHVVFYDLRTKRQASQFSSLSPLIREVGFRSRENLLFATSLKSAGVPISRKDTFLKDGRRQTYYILLSLPRHKDKARQVLKEDKNLKKFQRESS